MVEMIIRPTMKFIYLGYIVSLLAIAGIVSLAGRMEWPPWVGWASLVLILWPIKRHALNRVKKMVILDDKLRYETGALGKTTRTILISRVQDLTVHQSIGQRIFGVGDLSIETAGESSRLTIPAIDRPQEIADHIQELSAAAPEPARSASTTIPNVKSGS
jgi:uncharacterized membrane protein YdbT with pleckstrin-like domain